MSFEFVTAAMARRGLIAAVMLGGAMSISGTPAVAQNAEQEGSLGNWIKICAQEQGEEESQEVCLVTQEVRTDDGDFLASVSVRQAAGEENNTLMVAVPPGTLLQPGLRVQVDDGQQLPGNYVICLPNACYGELAIEESFVTSMKRGQNLVVSVINNQGQTVGVGLTLMGFTRSWDGPPVDTELLARERQRLQEQLQQRAAEARERLLQQQGESQEATE